MNTLNGSWPDLILTAAAAIALILLVFAVMQRDKARKIERKSGPTQTERNRRSFIQMPDGSYSHINLN